MKRSLSVLTIIFGLVSAVWAAEPSALTTLRSIHALTNAEASRALPVAFEATVTYYLSYEQVLFVQDDGLALYVQAPTNAHLLPGDRVLVRGKTHNSYLPEIFADSVTLLHHGDLPKPVPATFDQLIQGQLDSTFVKVHAVVRTADISLSILSPIRSIVLQTVTDGGIIHVSLDSDDPNALKDLLDAEVEIVGVASGRFDGKNQLTGIDVNVSKLEDIHILKRASVVPWSLPVTSMGDILSSYHEESRTKRVLVHGAITYYQPGSMVVLQNGDKTLRIMTHTYTPLRIGDLADATGFPDLSDGFLTLTSAEVQDSLVQAPVEPLKATWDQLAASGNIFDLVSIEGQVRMEVREAAQDEYVLFSDGHLFSAIYRHPDRASQIPLPAWKDIPLGSTVRITGICVLYNSDSFNGPVPFDILLRSFDDVTVIARPSWLSIRNLMVLIGLLLSVLFVVGARGWFIERRVRRQTASLAYVERRRSRILEDINNSRPLATTIEQITELVSYKLRGAPCWCQIADGAQLGNCPTKLAAFRVIQQDIPGRSGPALGVLFVALDPLTPPRELEAEALFMATALSALAIETRRLYADLHRRSEFDLLTDTHNRFSLDKRLDTLIAEARIAASVFGLIYIDLDEFKQINDLYGHHVGDRYLQEVAIRMKGQLRSHDLLARQGGDEFAALVTVVRNRADVEEIAQRLERCLDEPFVIEGYTVHGSASVGIALYPEDGETKGVLLNTADAAMYRVKHSGRHSVQLPIHLNGS
ncbi:MAG TPA: GGDEF domain-containing protein [Terracidiphilus sp.]|jgi:diguanylate cyclase (GGDEF)-like protein